MAGKDPPAKSRLELHTVAAGERFGRIYLGRYPDPLGYENHPADSATRGAASMPIVLVCCTSAIL